MMIMKKKVFSKCVAVIFASTVLFGCSQEFASELISETVNQECIKDLSQNRTYEEALAIAQDAIGLLGESSTTRSGKPRSINTNSVQYIINTSSTRSIDAPDTLMYVFNYEDNAGFAVVAASRLAEELLAVTEQGNYVVGQETGNVGFDLFMDLATAYLLDSLPKIELPEPGPGTLTEYKSETIRDTVSYGPYVTVRWGQEWPYNIYCYTLTGERAYAGCVATAIAQIMSYYRHPERLIISYDNSRDMQYLSWGNILQHWQSFNTMCACDEPSISHHQIARLIRQIGYYVSMNYGAVDGPDGSGAYSTNVYDALDYLGYKSSAFQPYTFDKVFSSLSGQKLVYMRGQIPNKGGHAWVVDGCIQITTTRTEYIRPQGYLFWQILEQHVYVDKYNHINWGWNGDCNGYFSSVVFNTASPHALDPNSTITGSANFTVNLDIYSDIEIDD